MMTRSEKWRKTQTCWETRSDKVWKAGRRGTTEGDKARRRVNVEAPGAASYKRR